MRSSFELNLESLVGLNLQTQTTSYLETALLFRRQIFPVLESYLNPQNNHSYAQKLQREFENLTKSYDSRRLDSLYIAKKIKAGILGDFIDQILSDPADFSLVFPNPPSIRDRIWIKTILIDDFIYYGPITILSISRILAKQEFWSDNPLRSLLLLTNLNQEVTEVRVNNIRDIFYELANKSYRWPIDFISESHLLTVIQRIIAESNMISNSSAKINSSNPIADFEHPCGYIRGSAIIPPASESGFLTLRLHPDQPYSLDDLETFAMLDSKIKDFLLAVQAAGTTVAIAGTMGSGKTTLLSALAEHWPDKGRKATIEDTPELRPRINDLIKMRTIEYDHDAVKDIDVTRLTKACKRHSVRYVVLSEARDGSAWEILQLSQSILGCLMTYHYTLRSNRLLVDQALNTLVALSRQNPLCPQDDSVKHLIASMVQILILVEQSPFDNLRRIAKIFHITGFDEMNGGHFKYIELFSYDLKLGFQQINASSELENYFRSKGVEYRF